MSNESDKSEDALLEGRTDARGDEDIQPKHAKAAATLPSKKKRRSIVALSVLLAVLLCAVVAGAGYLIWQQGELKRAAEQIENTPKPEVEPSEPEPESTEPEAVDDRIANPIDFSTLKLENPDIYAWIYIPDTNVNLPVLQRVGDDFFYIDHNRAGEYAVEGSIYTQMANSTSFSDPVTVLYGHNIENGTMFSTLHYFENEEFFNAHDTLYVYTMGHVLTYRIVSAYQYDDRHILNSYDFSDPAVLQAYFASVVQPDSLLVNVRAGAALAADSKIVQLSTCMSNAFHTNSRYIVTGVLIDDQPTY